MTDAIEVLAALKVMGFSLTERDIRKLYLKQCQTAHPDKGGSIEAFQRLNNAHKVLLSHFTIPTQALVPWQPLVTSKSSFVSLICHHLQARYLFDEEVYWSETSYLENSHAYSYIELRSLKSFVEKVHADEVKTFVQILVEAGCIPIPLYGVYTNALHCQIVGFLEGKIYCVPHSEGHITALRLPCEGMEYHETGEHRSSFDYSYKSREMSHFNLHECVKNLEGLERLDVYEQGCPFVLPPELSMLQNLKTIEFYIECGDYEYPEDWPGPEEVARTMALNALEMIIFYFEEGSSTLLSPAILSFLGVASFPALKELLIICETPNFPVLAPAFEVNKTLAHVQKIRLDGWDASEGESIPFLDYLTQLSKKCPHLNDISVNDPIQFFDHLDSGALNDDLLSTIYTKLEYLNLCDSCGNRHLEGLKVKMAKLLMQSKRLHSINREFLGSESPEGIDYEIEHLVRMNYGGGRILIPGTVCFGNPSKSVETLPAVKNMKGNEIMQDILAKLPLDAETKEYLESFLEDVDEEENPTPALPLSIWPQVLARADKDCREWCHYFDLDKPKRGKVEDCDRLRPQDCSVLYRMLRPNKNLLGPALEEIIRRE